MRVAGAALGAAARPLESMTWLAAMSAVTGRCGGNLARLRRMGYEKFTAAVRRELPRWGGKKLRHSIVRCVWEALADAGGVVSQRRGALERVRLVLGDWMSLLARLADVGERMTGVLDELGLTGLVTSIDGLSAVGAAVILAETGDLTRFSSARAVVSTTELRPGRERLGHPHRQTQIPRRGRPRLRAAAWRAVWGGMRHNQVLQDKHRRLTGRGSRQLSDGQARDGMRGGAAALAACRRHYPAGVGSADRLRRHPGPVRYRAGAASRIR